MNHTQINGSLPSEPIHPMPPEAFAPEYHTTDAESQETESTDETTSTEPRPKTRAEKARRLDNIALLMAIDLIALFESNTDGIFSIKAFFDRNPNLGLIDATTQEAVREYRKLRAPNKERLKATLTELGCKRAIFDIGKGYIRIAATVDEQIADNNARYAKLLTGIAALKKENIEKMEEDGIPAEVLTELAKRQQALAKSETTLAPHLRLTVGSVVKPRT